MLVDRDPLAPARALADEFCHFDLLSERDRAAALLKQFDMILPATENYRTLFHLETIAARCDVPLALDVHSYAISSSKIKSNNMFSLAGIAMPERWPECGYPVIVKPSGLSGSAGVVKVKDRAHLDAVSNALGTEAVIQKYLCGPSYSLEVLGHKGQCAGLQVTELNFDANYDCKRVLAGPDTGKTVAEAFYAMGERIAKALHLSGIMDIEVIDHDGELKVLEIDARLPSQTPSAVYHSTGVNMVELLADYWIHSRLPSWRRFSGRQRAVIFEHLRYHDKVLEVSGEHVLAGAQGLKVYQDKFSADVLISNFENSPDDWVATVIFVEETEAHVWEVRNRAIRIIQRAFKAEKVLDPEPFD